MIRPALVTTFMACLALSGCTQDTGTTLYAVPTIDTTQKQRIAYRAVEIREVSLPEYAQLSEMAVQTEAGGIATRPAQLWADAPVRAITLELSRTLGQITGATVASEPWPFDSDPEARVEVRVERMLATTDNLFEISGQYFVGSTDGGSRSRARVFDLSVPLPENAGPRDMAAARGRIVQDLALLIAKDGLR